MNYRYVFYMSTDLQAISKSSGADQNTGSDWFEVRKNISQLYHKTCSVKVRPLSIILKKYLYFTFVCQLIESLYRN